MEDGVGKVAGFPFRWRWKGWAEDAGLNVFRLGSLWVKDVAEGDINECGGQGGGGVAGKGCEEEGNDGIKR